MIYRLTLLRSQGCPKSQRFRDLHDKRVYLGSTTPESETSGRRPYTRDVDNDNSTHRPREGNRKGLRVRGNQFTTVIIPFTKTTIYGHLWKIISIDSVPDYWSVNKTGIAYGILRAFRKGPSWVK